MHSTPTPDSQKYLLYIKGGPENPGVTVGVKADGHVEFGPDYTPDAAARIFWTALAEFRPDGLCLLCKEKILKKEG